MNERQSHRSNIQQGEMELEFGGKKKKRAKGGEIQIEEAGKYNNVRLM